MLVKRNFPLPNPNYARVECSVNNCEFLGTRKELRRHKKTAHAY